MKDVFMRTVVCTMQGRCLCNVRKKRDQICFPRKDSLGPQYRLLKQEKENTKKV